MLLRLLQQHIQMFPVPSHVLAVITGIRNTERHCHAGAQGEAATEIYYIEEGEVDICRARPKRMEEDDRLDDEVSDTHLCACRPDKDLFDLWC